MSNFKSYVDNLNFNQTTGGKVVMCPNKEENGMNSLKKSIVDNEISTFSYASFE